MRKLQLKCLVNCTSNLHLAPFTVSVMFTWLKSFSLQFKVFVVWSYIGFMNFFEIQKFASSWIKIYLVLYHGYQAEAIRQFYKFQLCNFRESTFRVGIRPNLTNHTSFHLLQWQQLFYPVLLQVCIICVYMSGFSILKYWITCLDSNLILYVDKTMPRTLYLYISVKYLKF